MTIDDINFLCDLALHLKKNYRLSPHNTFCTGYSNGGEMCYLLAYKRPDIFTAVAPVAGLTLEWMYRELETNRPIPLFEIHGTEDKTSMWNRDPNNEGGWGKYIAVPIAVNHWAIQNRYEVWLYEIKGGKHSWGEKDLNTSEHIWLFFSKFVR